VIRSDSLFSYVFSRAWSDLITFLKYCVALSLSFSCVRISVLRHAPNGPRLTQISVDSPVNNVGASYSSARVGVGRVVRKRMLSDSNIGITDLDGSDGCLFLSFDSLLLIVFPLLVSAILFNDDDNGVTADTVLLVGITGVNDCTNTIS